MVLTLMVIILFGIGGLFYMVYRFQESQKKESDRLNTIIRFMRDNYNKPETYMTKESQVADEVDIVPAIPETNPVNEPDPEPKPKPKNKGGRPKKAAKK